MVNVALWGRLEAKPGKEAEVDAFLRAGRTFEDPDGHRVVFQHAARTA